MDRLLPVIALAAAAVAFAAIVQRRRPDPPTAAMREYSAPTQLDRQDFLHPERPWLVAVFSSASCTTCAAVRTAAAPLDSGEVAVHDVEVGERKDLHERYRVEAVPTTVIADADGVVVRSFMGPVSATHLWAAVAEAREPGSTPPGCGDDPSTPAT